MSPLTALIKMNFSDFPPLPSCVGAVLCSADTPAAVGVGEVEVPLDGVGDDERPPVGGQLLTAGNALHVTALAASATSRDDPAPAIDDGDARAIVPHPSMSSCRRFVTVEQSRLAVSMAGMTAWDHAGDDQGAIAGRVARRASLDATLRERWYAKALAAEATVRSADSTMQARVMITRDGMRRRSGSASPTVAPESPRTADNLATESTAADALPARSLVDAFLPAPLGVDTTRPVAVAPLLTTPLSIWLPPRRATGTARN